MAKSSILTRADEDLSAGRPYLAARRLRTLLAARPGDVEVYRRLAAAYRLAGDPVEAGRWGFVTSGVTDAELGAFQRAHPSPWVRLRLLYWPDQHHRPDPEAAERLRALVAAAEESGPPEGYHGPLFYREPRRRHTLAWLTLLLMLITGGVAGAYEVFALIDRYLF